MLLLCVNSVVYAQDTLERVDLMNMHRPISRYWQSLWQEESYNQALVILRELYQHARYGKDGICLDVDSL